MTNDTMMGSLYLLMAMFLVMGALINRREPAARLFKLALAWVTIFAAGFVVFSFRDDLGYVAQRLRAEATGAPVEDGREVRVPMAIDGHFWVDGRVNGTPVRFLVDSGASVTTVDRQTAIAAGMEIGATRDQEVQTGNGIIHVAAGRADRVGIAGIERRDVRVLVADNDNLNVLGMNWLSTLRGWSVEGRWLIMRP